MSRAARYLLMLGMSGGLATGCRDEPPPPEPPPPVEAVEQEVDEAHPFAKIRQAYGLPLPPEVSYLRKGPDFIEVGTPMRVDELERFFKSRLVDYEFIPVGKYELRIVGLHSTMPRVTIMRFARQQPTAVRYVQQSGTIAKQMLAKNPVRPAKKGERLTEKLSSGKEVAPGAVYGQPYTPKPGDPLFKKRYRSNFGKPLGEWVLF